MKDIKYIHARNKLREAMIQTVCHNEEWQTERNDIIDKIFHHNYCSDFLSLSLEEKGLVSYVKPGTDYASRYDTKCRIKTKLGRYLNKRFSNAIQPGNLSQFACDVVSRLNTRNIDERFVLLSGDDIVDAYRDEVGCETCMSGRDCDKVTIYAINPESVRLLCALDDSGEKIARALLWYDDFGNTVLDRIYPNTGEHIALYSLYCAKHHVELREDNSLPDRTNQHNRLSLEVTLTLPDDCILPYMDTFTTFNYDYGDCEAVFFNSDKGRYNACNTDGGPICNRLTCSGCGCVVDEDNFYSPEYSDGVYCDCCYSELFYYCPCCECDVPRNNIVHIEDIDEYYCDNCASEHCAVCDDCGAYVHEHTEVEGGDCVCNNCIDNYTQCEECDAWVKTEDAHNIDGCMYCDDCAPECEFAL